jgi:hypothetical protein
MMRRTITAALVVTLLTASPALAGSPGRKAPRGQTIAKWTLIGAAAGFGIGFLHGMSAYDDAPYAEEKIWREAWIAALTGGIAGGVFGVVRSGGQSPVTRKAPTLQLSQPHLRLRAPASQPDRIYRSLFGATAFETGSATRAPSTIAAGR